MADDGYCSYVEKNAQLIFITASGSTFRENVWTYVLIDKSNDQYHYGGDVAEHWWLPLPKSRPLQLAGRVLHISRPQ